MSGTVDTNGKTTENTSKGENKWESGYFIFVYTGQILHDNWPFSFQSCYFSTLWKTFEISKITIQHENEMIHMIVKTF